MYSSISAGESNWSWMKWIFSISSFTLFTTEVASIPMEPSSESGLTISGNSMSCAW